MDSCSTISPRLSRYKLNASFNGKTVTHLTIKTNLEAKQRRIEVQTVWQTEGRLGSGAFGVVWRQRADSGLVRAVKVISREQLNIQEVEALIDLQDHPDLFIRFFGWFEDLNRDAIHLAMEYIEHGHLGTYITQYQTKVNTKEITAQILEGLVVLHEREICHRDLKPQNILVASLSPIWVKISDFGISKRWVGTSLKTHCGTAIYRAPEQLGILPREFRAAGNSYTNNIDIWALGAIVHEMLTLEIPFLDTYSNENSGFTSCLSIVEASVDTGLLYGYCHGAQPFPCSRLRSQGVAEDGIEFVKNLMAVNPSERLSAAVALRSEWLAQKQSPHRPASPEPVIPALAVVACSTGLPEPSPITEEEDVYIPPFHELFHTAKETDKVVVDSPQYPEPPPPTRAEQRGRIDTLDPLSLSATSQTSAPFKTSRLRSIRDIDLPSNMVDLDQAVRTGEKRRRSSDLKEEEIDSRWSGLPSGRSPRPPPGEYEQSTMATAMDRVAPFATLQLPGQHHGSSSEFYDHSLINPYNTHTPAVVPRSSANAKINPHRKSRKDQERQLRVEEQEPRAATEFRGESFVEALARIGQNRIDRRSNASERAADTQPRGNQINLRSEAPERATITHDLPPVDVATSTQKPSSYSGTAFAGYHSSWQRGENGKMIPVGSSPDHRAPDTIRQRGKYGEISPVPEPETRSPNLAHVTTSSHSASMYPYETTRQRGKYEETSASPEPVTYLPHVRSGYSGSLRAAAYDTTQSRGRYGELMTAPTPPSQRILSHDTSSADKPHESRPVSLSPSSPLLIHPGMTQKIIPTKLPSTPTRWDEFKDGLRKAFKGSPGLN